MSTVQRPGDAGGGVMARRYDATGEAYDDEVDRQAPPAWHDPRCRDGWLPDTADGRPVACATCKPHVARQQQRRPRRLEQPASPHVQAAAMTEIRRAFSTTAAPAHDSHGEPR